MSKYFNEVGIQSIQDLVTRINQAFAKIELEGIGGISYGGGGITKLSELEIDIDKDWADRSINHLHSISIQPEFIPTEGLDTVLIQHSDKTLKTMFRVFTDDFGVSHSQNFLNFTLSGYNLLLGIEHEYRRPPLPINTYYAVMNSDLDTLFNMKSLSVNAYDGFSVYGNYIYLDTPDLEFVLSTDAELTFYRENQNVVITGRSENLFRIQDMEDIEKHVVDSIYHDDTQNLDIVGTRWAMKVDTVDYHLVVGNMYDINGGTIYSGIFGQNGYINFTDETGLGIYTIQSMLYIEADFGVTILGSNIDISAITGGMRFQSAGNLLFYGNSETQFQSAGLIRMDTPKGIEMSGDENITMITGGRQLSIYGDEGIIIQSTIFKIISTSGDIILSPAGLINFSQKQAINFIIENYYGEPANAVTGRIIFNTQTGQFEGYNGTSWIQFGGGGGISKLSQLEIDVDKDWLGHSINNISGISYGNRFNLNAIAIDYNIDGATGTIANSNGGTTIQAYQNLTLACGYNYTTWLSGTYVAVSSDLYGEWTCNYDLNLNSNYGTINLFASSGISLSVHNAFIDFIFGGDVAHLHHYYNPTDDVIDIYADKPIRISNLVGGGGGITKLSQLEIDVDKDWAGHSITNFGTLTGNDLIFKIPSENTYAELFNAGIYIKLTNEPGITRYFEVNADYSILFHVDSTYGYWYSDINGMWLCYSGYNVSLPSPNYQSFLIMEGDGSVYLNGKNTLLLSSGGDITLNPASGNLIVHGLQLGNDPCKILIGDTISGNSEIDIFPDVNDGSIGIQIVNAINNFTIQKRYINIWGDTLDISTNAGIIDMGSASSGDIFITANNTIYLNGSMVNVMCETVFGNTLYMQSTLNMQNNNIININSLVGSAINITSIGGNITLNPSNAIDFSKKQSKNHVLEKWTTSTRPSNPVEGQVGYNTDTHQFEGWNGTSWVVLG
jgi:hypothetical protein